MSSLSLIPGLGSLFGNAGKMAAGAGAGIPMSIALPVLFSFLSSSGLFGGGEDEYEKWKREKEQQKLLQLMKPQYPAGAYQVNPAMFQGVNSAAYQAVLNHLKRMTNFGYPEGMGIDTSFIDEILSNMPASMSYGGYGGKQRLTSSR